MHENGIKNICNSKSEISGFCRVSPYLKLERMCPKLVNVLHVVKSLFFFHVISTVIIVEQ